MQKYEFLIRETLTEPIMVEADSLEAATAMVQEIYDEGFNVDGFAGVEFLPHVCKECGNPTTDDDDGERSRVTYNIWKEDECELCFACHREKLFNGQYTQCENCEMYFTTNHMLENPETGGREICPYCG